MEDKPYEIHHLGDPKEYAQNIEKYAESGHFGIVDDVLKLPEEKTGKNFSNEEVLDYRIQARENFIITERDSDAREATEGASLDKIYGEIKALKLEKDALSENK